MAQRVRIPHRGHSPSSARQLPILAALHARSPTLFAFIIHEEKAIVNGFFRHFCKIAPLLTEIGYKQERFCSN